MYSQKQARPDQLLHHQCEFEAVKRDGLMSSFNVAGTLSLQFIAKKIIKSKFRFDSRNCVSGWSTFLIDNTNSSGSMDFVVPPADSLASFSQLLCLVFSYHYIQ
ncbi:uncharacterized protein LOC116140035 isoform X2 [Pistacia vera]|uniref:uncharacterized protein LOC116140035 isoform X2 n=1 Tax=Pistacia vera TaxID=55513 RepID=UPI0012636144|nr:uncharacterized protein LOC116140035 isoform X2 [Pistacia vera]